MLGDWFLDPIEKAIRNAFEKGDAEDPAFRARIYESAHSALERAMKAHPEMTVEAAILRRRRLEARIAEIEAEYEQAEDADVSLGPATRTFGEDDTLFPTLDDDHRHEAPDVMLDGRREDELGPMPDMERLPDGMYAPVPAEVAPDPDPRRPRRGRRRVYAIGFVLATVIAAVGIGAWWATQTGLLQTAAERDTSVPNPPQTTQDEDFTPDEEATPAAPPPLNSSTTPDRNWINVFTPADPTLVSAPQGASAEVMQDESGSFLRVRSGASASAVLFDVGQGILEQAAGKRAVFDIIARAEEGKETEITVDCNFGELGDCGRKRYLVGYERGEYLFEVALPDRAPGAGGTIAINSDFSSEGKSVDIYEIRISVSE